MRLAMIVAVIFAMGACSGEERAESPEPTGGAERPTVAPPPPPPAEPERELDPETACGRALACCRAFAAVVPNVVEESACEGPFEVEASRAEGAAPDSDARCERMRAGWSEALALANGEPPAACAD